MRALQARVRALQRKLAKELAVVRLRRLSEEFCIESSVSQSERPTAVSPPCLYRTGGLRRLPAPVLHGGPQVPRAVPGQRDSPRPRRPPPLPHSLVPSLSRSRLLAGMKAMTQSSSATSLSGTRRAITFKRRRTSRGRYNSMKGPCTYIWAVYQFEVGG